MELLGVILLIIAALISIPRRSRHPRRELPYYIRRDLEELTPGEQAAERAADQEVQKRNRESGEFWGGAG